jgi:tetratricopeptide (TPR) repeat protein
LVFVLFALGLMAKPMLITLPCVLLLLDYWPLGRMNAAWQIDPTAPTAKNADRQSTFRNGLRLLIEKIPLFLVAGADSVATILVQAKSLNVNEQLSLSWRIGNAMVSYVTYLEMFFYPVGLVIVYPRLPLELPPWTVAGSVLILVAIAAIVFAARRRCPYLLVGWLWYLGMMAPVIGFLQVGLTAVADRFTYLPQIGIVIALVWGVADLCRGWKYRSWACGAAAAIVLTALMGCAFHLTAQWRDNETLWKYVIRCMPDNVVAHCNLGNALAEEGRLKDAVAHIEDALAVAPTSSVANYNMGCILMVSGRLEPAKEYFTKALAANPNSGGACNRLGVIYAEQGEYDKAIAFFRKALEIDRNDPEANYDLGKALMADGQRDQANEVLREAKQIAPDYATSHRKLGAIVAARGRWVEAIEHYQRVLDAEPEDVETRLSLVDVLVKENRLREATVQVRAVLKIDPNNAEARQKLAALQAAIRRPK